MADRIFGHDWECIQRAQRGGRLNRTIDTSKPPAKQEPTDEDKALLARYGADGLIARGFHGTIGRLVDAGLMKAAT